ncbi:MAG: response regulator [Elusimicrobia bacterium]|nr:response regulator [Elusimicrobiota bacterium]
MKTAELSLFIIEDDPHFRETLIDVMALRGVTVTAAGSGTEGLKALKGQKPSVIILDVQLPDIHGLDLCKVIKRSEPFKNTPVIMLSASTRYSDPRDRVEGILAGASAFLSKPITMEKLWDEIEALTQRR